MAEFHQLQKQASDLRKQEKYADALTVYEILKTQFAEEMTEWDLWGHGSTLRELGRSDEALEIGRDLYRKDPDFDRGRILYGWCIYDIGIKKTGDKFDEVEFLKAADAITQVTVQEKYSPFELTVFAVIDHYKSYEDTKKSVPYGEILKWLKKLDLNLLSTEPGRDKNGREYESPKEKYYSRYVKVLKEIERYEECMDICSRALSEFSVFHNDNDVWFRNHRAECFFSIGKFEEALFDFEYMADRKPDPWIRQKIAEVLHAIGRQDEAIRFASEAAINDKELGYRWEVFLDLGNMLCEKGEIELAKKHILLAYAIRQEKGWEKMPDKLQSSLKACGISENLVGANSRNLHRELLPFWKSMEPKVVHVYRGRIEQIHANGKSGHIRSEDGMKYFFGMRSYKGDEKAIEGLSVAFNLKEELNKKKGEMELHAVDVVVIS